MKGSLVAKLGSSSMVSVVTTTRFEMVLMANTAACLVLKVGLLGPCLG